MTNAKKIYRIVRICYVFFSFNDENLTKYSQIIDIFNQFRYNDKCKIRFIVSTVPHNSHYVISAPSARS